ncbi:MAG: tRNA pseudouridine(38-40) synthase TruA [Chloracidobacterium sp.]|nr:tRNA pseudouridine(38-40) synthase TruA [Chloracidobacterium sp.]MDW8216426.1 tRNA pseudouridine(38-40) synthase TruA [Acidobacteriota bacterium]
MPRLKLTVEYDGTDYAGWQAQTNARSIQSVLAAAFVPLTGRPARLYAAGRTDAGVHALGQVVHTDVTQSRTVETWQSALNAHLPPDIRVRRVEVVGEDFHARKSARAKLYHYAFWRGRVESPRWRRYSLTVPTTLDWAAMDAAARHFVGCHDFAPFSVADRTVQTTVRTIHAVTWHPSPAEPTLAAGDPLWPSELVAVAFYGDGFLRHQVRRMVGALLAVGQRKLAPDVIRELLCGAKQFATIVTAPPHGLTLLRVDY